MIWYPYEQMKTMKEPIKIVDAKGVYLYAELPDEDSVAEGHSSLQRDTPRCKRTVPTIDAVSSWWCQIHGYCNPEITEAIKAQADNFSHVMLGGLTHDPVQRLSKKLAEWLPGDLNYCFFSDSGSVAVEVALKMALQYYVNIGQKHRIKIMSLTHSYHGDTFKTMEAGDDEDYHFILEVYGENPNVIHVPTTIPELEEAFEKHHEDIYCFIVEPLLQGAGGMRMYDISYLRRARELCDQYGVLLIFDEVATGFGRTGYRFVADEVLPDIIVLGKALTGGHIGHAATVANQKVYDAFYSDDADKALMHGPTFMGNALACVAALKSIELFEKNDYMSKIHHITEIFHEEMDGFSHEAIKEVRMMGGCLCIEVKDPASLKGYQEYALRRGVFARPFLSYLYTMPPYIIEDDDLRTILRCMKEWFQIP